MTWASSVSRHGRYIRSMNSTQYWIERYRHGGTSGAGSTGRLNVFKSALLGSIIDKYNIESVLDLGCGQGAILDLIEIIEYLGYDPSMEVVQFLKDKYSTNLSMSFEYDLNKIESKELVISFDVIFHLIEDSVYEQYMKSLFHFSTNYVLIYSSNTNREDSVYATAPHVKHRFFQEKIPHDFNLLEIHENLFPYSPNDQEKTSWSDFYLYKRI